MNTQERIQTHNKTKYNQMIISKYKNLLAKYKNQVISIKLIKNKKFKKKLSLPNKRANLYSKRAKCKLIQINNCKIKKAINLDKIMNKIQWQKKQVPEDFH